MQLRTYQKEAVAAVHREWSEGRLRTLLGQATGTGKTVEFSQITKDQVDEGERVLQLAHREEVLTIVQQLREGKYKTNPVRRVEIPKEDMHHEESENI